MHRLGALVPLALGLLWIAYALTSFPLGQLNRPGPAMWPTIVGTVLVMTSLVLFFTGQDKEDQEPFTTRWPMVAMGAGSIGAFIVLYEVAGFIVGAILVLLFWCRYLGSESWRLSVTVAVAGAGGFYAIFGLLLGVPLPATGILM